MRRNSSAAVSAPECRRELHRAADVDAGDGGGDVFTLMNVLHEEVGIVGPFSDWPATTTYHANCVGLE